MPTSPMPDPRDYPDPIGYAVASADWWRARVQVTRTTRRVLCPPTAQTLAFAVAGAICGLAIMGHDARFGQGAYPRRRTNGI